MATKASKKTVAIPGYADKDATPLQVKFANWLTEQTGIEVDLKSVQLATALRMEYQRSDANQADLAARRQAAIDAVAAREERAKEREAKREAREAAAAAKAEAKAKAPAKAATKAAPKAKATSGPVAKAAKAATPKPAPKKAPTRRKPVVAADDEV